MELKNYTVGLFAFCTVISALSLFPLNEQMNTVRKRAFALLTFALAVLPLCGFIRDGIPFPDVTVRQVAFENGGETCIREGFEDGVRSAVCEAFSLPEDGVEVHVTGLDIPSFRAERVRVILRGKAVFADSRAIASYIEKEGWGEADVVVEIG